MASDQLKDRVARLVKAVHGTTNAAAHAIGIPQRTLSRIVSGESPHPRVDHVQRLAQFYQADLQWLLDGSGQVPRVLQEPGDRLAGVTAGWADSLAWWDVIALLNLPYAIRSLLVALGDAPLYAVLTLAPPARKGLPDVSNALERTRGAWASLLHAMIAEWGLDVVRQRLIDRLPQLAVGFSPFLVHLLEERSVTLPADIQKAYTDFSPPRPVISVASLIDRSANAKPVERKVTAKKPHRKPKQH